MRQGHLGNIARVVRGLADPVAEPSPAIEQVSELGLNRALYATGFLLLCRDAPKALGKDNALAGGLARSCFGPQLFVVLLQRFEVELGHPDRKEAPIPGAICEIMVPRTFLAARSQPQVVQMPRCSTSCSSTRAKLYSWRTGGIHRPSQMSDVRGAPIARTPGLACERAPDSETATCAKFTSHPWTLMPRLRPHRTPKPALPQEAEQREVCQSLLNRAKANIKRC